MTELKQKLFKVTKQWRRTARSTRGAAKDVPNLLARGHMHGMSDGLDVAADDVAELVNKPVPAAPPSVNDRPHAPFHADNRKPGS